MFVENHVPNIQAVFVFNFMLKLDTSDNEKVNAIVNSDIKLQSRLQLIKMLYLYMLYSTY